MISRLFSVSQVDQARSKRIQFKVLNILLFRHYKMFIGDMRTVSLYILEQLSYSKRLITIHPSTLASRYKTNCQQLCGCNDAIHTYRHVTLRPIYGIPVFCCFRLFPVNFFIIYFSPIYYETECKIFQDNCID